MNKFKIELKWAFILTAATLVWMYFEKMMGWHGESIEKHAIYTNLFGILAIVIYVFALLEKREKYFKGIMSWQQGFLSGSILSIIIAAITPFAQYVAHTFISPEYFKNIISFTVDNELMKAEMAEEYYRLSTFMYQSAFLALSYGVVTSAVVAWFVKKEKSDQTLT